MLSSNGLKSHIHAKLNGKHFSVWIGYFRSHPNIKGTSGKALFDKDLLEVEVFAPDGQVLYIFIVHPDDTVKEEKAERDVKRKEQAAVVAKVYNELQRQGKNKVIVAGTLNAVSFCDSLTPLLRETNLHDIKKHQSFDVDLDSGKDSEYYSLGAYRMGVNLKQKDYFLVAPDLFRKIKKSGLNRKGIGPEKREQWRVLDSIHGEAHQASMHPLIWAELSI